ncbi:MAG TPA: PaaI family thioesterase [Verrucomicrobiae bacterium]|nr:PaaI family thioesterase [Verrucomicrobiae bacterium]
MQKLPHTKSCFVCGTQNPTGLKLDFETDGNVVRSRFVPQPGWVGFQQTLHGGIVATILDEVMVWACGVQTKRLAYCAELTVRFVQPVRPGEETVATGEVTLNRRNKIVETKGEIRDADGGLLASATAKYIPLKEEETAKMLGDFAEDPGMVFGAASPK